MSSIEIPTTRPEHQVHGSSDPLPGARGVQPAADYSAATMEHAPSSAFDPENIDNPHIQTNLPRWSSTSDQAAFDSERPLDTRPVPEGKQLHRLVVGLVID